MPEFLYPGVYLEEAAGAEPIEGVPTSSDPAPPCGPPLKRPTYFSGRLLDAATLTAEQDYHREKIRRHNRALVGYGVVTGLDVRVERSGGDAGPKIVVGAGYAVDRRGEEICLPCEVRILPPAKGEPAFVTIRFWEHPLSPSPAGGQPAASEMEEACVIGIGSQVLSTAIALARLVRTAAGAWESDPGFTPPRAALSHEDRF
jgi:hypothetical protein